MSTDKNGKKKASRIGLAFSYVLYGVTSACRH